jgi:hypothetical protein
MGAEFGEEISEYVIIVILVSAYLLKSGVNTVLVSGVRASLSSYIPLVSQDGLAMSKL